GKGIDRFLLTSYERDAIRPRIWGRFEDLLMATAKSPAMMFYLDNAKSRANALNENYAREIMELHTLGVDGGYTQKDVTEVARALQQIGEPLYGSQPPTGFSDKSEAWINSGALMSRLNFVVALANNQLPGVRASIADPKKTAIELGSPDFQRQ